MSKKETIYFAHPWDKLEEHLKRTWKMTEQEVSKYSWNHSNKIIGFCVFLHDIWKSNLFFQIRIRGYIFKGEKYSNLAWHAWIWSLILLLLIFQNREFLFQPKNRKILVILVIFTLLIKYHHSKLPNFLSALRNWFTSNKDELFSSFDRPTKELFEYFNIDSKEFEKILNEWIIENPNKLYWNQEFSSIDDLKWKTTKDSLKEVERMIKKYVRENNIPLKLSFDSKEVKEFMKSLEIIEKQESIKTKKDWRKKLIRILFWDLWWKYDILDIVNKEIKNIQKEDWLSLFCLILSFWGIFHASDFLDIPNVFKNLKYLTSKAFCYQYVSKYSHLYNKCREEGSLAHTFNLLRIFFFCITWLRMWVKEVFPEFLDFMFENFDWLKEDIFLLTNNKDILSYDFFWEDIYDIYSGKPILIDGITGIWKTMIFPFVWTIISDRYKKITGKYLPLNLFVPYINIQEQQEKDFKDFIWNNSEWDIWVLNSKKKWNTIEEIQKILWLNSINISTSVRLIESINVHNKKNFLFYSSLMNGINILDESHTIPYLFLWVFEKVCIERTLFSTKEWNPPSAYHVFCSATQRKQNIDSFDIIPKLHKWIHFNKIFNSITRSNIYFLDKWKKWSNKIGMSKHIQELTVQDVALSLSNLAKNEENNDKTFLCILNTKWDVRQANVFIQHYMKWEKYEFYNIASCQTQNQRNKIMKKTKYNQEHWIKTIVIGTQSIEAWVDLDFDYIFTDICPLDSIIQRFWRTGRNMNFIWTCFVFQLYQYKETKHWWKYKYYPYQSIYQEDWEINKTKEILERLMKESDTLYIKNNELSLTYEEYSDYLKENRKDNVNQIDKYMNGEIEEFSKNNKYIEEIEWQTTICIIDDSNFDKYTKFFTKMSNGFSFFKYMNIIENDTLNDTFSSKRESIKSDIKDYCFWINKFLNKKEEWDKEILFVNCSNKDFIFSDIKIESSWDMFYKDNLLFCYSW